jgi:hypothetical protein
MLIPAACLFTFGIVTLVLMRRERHAKPDGARERRAEVA